MVSWKYTVGEDRLDLGPVPLAQLDDGASREGGKHGAEQLEGWRDYLAQWRIRRRPAAFFLGQPMKASA